MLKDDVEAVKWYRKSAEQGNDIGQALLGDSYFLGRGVAKDDVEAAKWRRKSAEQGNAIAQYALGFHYAKGEGLPKDDIEAYKWFNLASAKGLIGATKGREILERFMTGEQIAEAQKLSREWKPRTSQ